MEIAFECPVPNVEFSVLGDFYFVLGNLAMESSHYFNYFKFAGRRKVLDNGAYDVGKSIPPNDLLSLARAIRADVVVCPDAIGNAKETLDKTRDFISLVKSRRISVSLMGVPQGSNESELQQCFDQMWEAPEISAIGLSLVGIAHALGNKTNLSGARHLFIMKNRERLFSRRKQVHLLGFGNLKEYEGYPSWWSQDTSAPFLAAQQGKRIDYDFEDFNKITRPKLDFNKRLLSEQVELAMLNLSFLKYYLGNSSP